MYHSRKLPHIIGTQSFLGDEFVGLENLSETEDLEVSESSDESEDELDVEGPVQNLDSVQAEEPKSNPNGNMYPDNPDADADSEFSEDEESVMQPPPKLTKQKVFSDLSNDENAEDQDIKSDIIDPDNFQDGTDLELGALLETKKAVADPSTLNYSHRIVCIPKSFEA